MPRIVDHEQRRAELSKHVWALIRREGLSGVTLRSLSEQSGWSSGAIRHYLPNRGSILTFAAEQLSAEVEKYLRNLDLDGSPVENFERFLLALLPTDETSREWLEVWLAFTTAAVQGEDYADAHGVLYRDVHAIIVDILNDFAEKQWLEQEQVEPGAAELHALVDGLALHLLLKQMTIEQAQVAIRISLERMLQTPIG